MKPIGKTFLIKVNRNNNIKNIKEQFHKRSGSEFNNFTSILKNHHKDNNHILGIQYHPEVDKDDKPFKWLIKIQWEFHLPSAFRMKARSN